MIAAKESAALAEALIAETVAKPAIAPGTLTLHADRGTSRRSKPVAALLVDLDVAKSHSRPHVSTVRALHLYGGVTQLIVPDNARAMIADPNRYKPRANDTVLDFARHYGYLAHPKMCLVDSSRLHFASRP